MAFAIAGIIFVVTLIITVFVAFANGMSDAPGATVGSPLRILVIGTIIAVLVAASHYAHGFHISW